MRMARQEAWHRNIAASMAGRKVFDSWKIPEIDERPAREYKPITDEERRIADKIWKLRKTQ